MTEGQAAPDKTKSTHPQEGLLPRGSLAPRPLGRVSPCQLVEIASQGSMTHTSRSLWRHPHLPDQQMNASQEKAAEAGRYQLLKTPKSTAGWLALSGPKLAHLFPKLPLPVLHQGRLLWVHCSGSVDRLYKGSIATQPKS